MAADPGNIRNGLPNIGPGPFKEVSVKASITGTLDFLDSYADLMNGLAWAEAEDHGGEPNKGEAAHSRKSMAAVALAMGAELLRDKAAWVQKKLGDLPPPDASKEAKLKYARDAYQLSKKHSKQS